jgi:hypothetical protein
MTDLPPELAAFASVLDAQPEPVRAAFAYCLALAMVQGGKARLVETRPGDASPVCVFETAAGDTSVARTSTGCRAQRWHAGDPCDSGGVMV